MQISICPSNPPHCFFYQRHKNPLWCALISPNWSFSKYWQDPMPLSIRITKSYLSTWYVFVYSRLLLDLDS